MLKLKYDRLNRLGLALLVALSSILAGCHSLSFPKPTHHQSVKFEPNQRIIIISNLGDANFQSYTKANCWLKYTCDGDQHFDYTHPLQHFDLNDLAMQQIKQTLKQQGAYSITLLNSNIKDYYKDQRSYGPSTYNYADKQTEAALKQQLKGKSYDYVILLSRIHRSISSTPGALPSGAYGLWQLRVKKRFRTLLYWDYTLTLYNHKMHRVRQESKSQRIDLLIDHWITHYEVLKPAEQALMQQAFTQQLHTTFKQSVDKLIH